MQTISGIVVRGDGYGRKLGYPTANVEITESLSGVFAGKVLYKGTEYLAALFATPKRKVLETHVLDFDGDLYGEILVVEVHNKIREAAEFASDEVLKATIADDVKAIRKQFGV